MSIVDNERKKTKRREAISKILSAPRWHDCHTVDDIEKYVLAGLMSVSGLRYLDRLLEAVEMNGNHADTDFLYMATRSWSLTILRTTRQAFWVLLETAPLLLAFDAEIQRRANEEKPFRPKAPPRNRRFSVPLKELPAPWRAALERMENGLPGIYAQAPVPAMIATTRTKLCEYIKAARDAGLPDEFSPATAVAYETSLARREKSLSPVTIKSAIRQVDDFAKYIGADEETLEHLRKRVRRNENRAKRAPSTKEPKVLAIPDFTEIFGMAFDLLGQAEHTRNPRKSQALRNKAVAITFFLPFPLRLVDTRLRFGEEIHWTERGYHLQLTTSKTGWDFSAPILPEFAFFVDQLILRGSGQQHLHSMREACLNERRPLMVKHDGRAPHGAYVSFLWRQALGTGCHAARTKLHDEFARFGDRGVELAMRACGHRSEKTAEHYRTRAFEMLSLEKTHQDLQSSISEVEWKQYFGQE